MLAVDHVIQHLEGDCRKVLPTLPARSIRSCITSPPFWRLRSYLPHSHPSKASEIGQERTVREYIETLVGVFRQVARVLTVDGTLWLNVGDSYADAESAKAAGVKNGDLLGLPWEVAQALRADGWLLRSSVIWHKPNPKPEGGLTNRPTSAHEYLFLLAKGAQYYYDINAIRAPVTSTGGACFGKHRHSTEGTGAQRRRLTSASTASAAWLIKDGSTPVRVPRETASRRREVQVTGRARVVDHSPAALDRAGFGSGAYGSIQSGAAPPHSKPPLCKLCK